MIETPAEPPLRHLPLPDHLKCNPIGGRNYPLGEHPPIWGETGGAGPGIALFCKYCFSK